MEGCTEEEHKEKLLWNVKREVKQIMEEAVTRKFVHEDSSHIIALCTAIEACLSHLLKRRAAGFLRSDKIAALFTKVGKVYDTAGEVCRKVQEQLQQQADLTRRAQSVGHEPLRRRGSSTTSRPPQPLSAQAIKHIWVRTALFEKVLDKIIQHIVDNSSNFYEREALMHDPVFGPILAALLVGPCALEYTKLKTSDHFWTDPSANELVQRHRIHGAHRSLDVSSGRRPALGIRKRQSSGSMSEDRFAASAREYVESLHQNSRTHLLYGKNNVLVQPKKDMEVLRGYLSLHQAGDNLTLKWTPNQLINGTLGDCDLEKSIYWDYALTVPLRQIVCIHCHQRPDCGGTLVLVSQDGIQRPPLQFPPGGHLLAFLSCLETGLLPRGQLEPPLWSQKGKGKVFPKLRKRSSAARLMEQDRNSEEQTAADYVFRIVYPGYRYDSITINYHHTTGSRAPSLDDDEEEEDRLHAMISMICSRNLTDPNVLKDHGEMMEMQGLGGSPSSWQQTEVTTHELLCQSCSTAGSNTSFNYTAGCTCLHQPSDIHTIPLKMLCQNMKRQIVSRAFYGWLAYCRHLSTVRTHLSALVNHNIVPPDRPCEASGGLSKEVWSKYQKDCKNYKELELLRLVYYGGVQHEIRKEVWPFLLGHYKFGMSKKDMSQIDAKINERYQQVMREWKACEVIVKQREKEMQSAIFAKLSSGSSIDSHVLRLAHRDSTLSNEVFMSVDEPDAESQETPNGEDSTPIMTILAPPAAVPPEERPLVEFDSPDSGLPSSRNYSVTSAHSQILSSIDDGQSTEEEVGGREEGRTPVRGRQDSLIEDRLCNQLDKLVTSGADSDGMSASLSSYTIELLDTVALNLHRIDKDVQRCDRNYYYFTTANLEKLRNIMCSYVWEHLEMGYVQGMCDLLAPLVVILDDESLAYSCFTQLMKRMSQNFPNGGAMDTHFANMRSLIQILDSELFELMQQNGDYTHFYFCYRWFLLDFKRELLYEDVFAVWEVIWVAPRISSRHFVLFLALALVTVYREIIIDNNMDFTDIIKFFNEMAERHDVQLVLRMARELVHKVQSLMDNK
ncbi:small G protein signaling modulator 2 isoform X2 [Girardinichthys multiradiatus]|uniref:small G protein signaling modulator 2 isoform X2 n=1 Tax=Girardinichthys multiradiatus TaxID=208333 RepID=UPI001FAD7377|nr:small G protein signaling modulator 2 isoform X2 [Girardinichthys multiradiatus]